MSPFYFKFQFRNVEYSSGRNKTLLCYRVDTPGGSAEPLKGYLEDEHATAHAEEAFFQQVMCFPPTQLFTLPLSLFHNGGVGGDSAPVSKVTPVLCVSKVTHTGIINWCLSCPQGFLDQTFEPICESTGRISCYNQHVSNCLMMHVLLLLPGIFFFLMCTLIKGGTVYYSVHLLYSTHFRERHHRIRNK